MNRKTFVGMALDERLRKAGLLATFAAALRARDEAQMLSLLAQVDISGASATDTVKSLLLDPQSHEHFR